MLKKQFQSLLIEADSQLSSQAYNVLESMQDMFEDGFNITEDDFCESIYEYIDSEFIYYQDAWDYLEDNQITDFEDAIKNYGAYDVCSIASYYLEQEIMNFLYENWDYYESEEDEEDEDEEDE